MAAKSKKPEIRFAGFEDEWEQRNLGNIIDLRSGRDYKHLSAGEIPVYGTGGYMLSVNEALSYKEDAIGIGRKGTIDKPYLLRAPFWTVDTLFYALPDTNNDLDFIFDIFQNINWKQRDESTGVPSLSKTAINEIDVLIPEFKEQVKTGTFMRQLDNLITLQQKKVEKLKNIKSACMEKMFPQGDSDTPELRFGGFTEPWEQRKMGNIIDLRSGRDYKHLSIGEIPVYGTGGYMLRVNDALSYKEDAIGIGRKGTIDKPYILRAPFWTVDTLFYALPDTNNDLDFIFDIFQNINWKQRDESTGVPSLSKTAINETDVLIPEFKEQKIIGDFFQQLDHIITLQQQKVQKLKNIKSACMEKMFV